MEEEIEEDPWKKRSRIQEESVLEKINQGDSWWMKSPQLFFQES